MKKIRRLISRLRHQINAERRLRINVLRDFGHFSPASNGDWKTKSLLTVATLRKLPESLDLLMQIASGSERPLAVTELLEKEELASNAEQESRLEMLYRKFGSDKSTGHDYHRIYANLFPHLDRVKTVFEIGIGSNNPKVVSHMGARHSGVGGSLRAHQEFFPDSQVFGFDIDRGSFITDERISCDWVDQTDYESIKRLGGLAPSHGIDLIIDDGLHSLNANLNSLAGLLPLLSSEGWMIVEDIDSRLNSIWGLVCTWLNQEGYRTYLLDMKDASVLAVRRDLDN